jgi:hypothetical protein
LELIPSLYLQLLPNHWSPQPFFPAQNPLTFKPINLIQFSLERMIAQTLKVLPFLLSGDYKYSSLFLGNIL